MSTFLEVSSRVGKPFHIIYILFAPCLWSFASMWSCRVLHILIIQIIIWKHQSGVSTFVEVSSRGESPSLSYILYYNLASTSHDTEEWCFDITFHTETYINITQTTMYYQITTLHFSVVTTERSSQMLSSLKMQSAMLPVGSDHALNGDEQCCRLVATMHWLETIKDRCM